ncbi:hypothetical protein F4604DRAFT_1922835 [Suillus subluteus]|nr:hypothetical protein F4604DRAFT_1922835 [Suillus subluteus]
MADHYTPAPRQSHLSRQSHHASTRRRRQALHLNARAMDITSLFAAMQQHHQLATMPFLDLTTFLRCTSLLKDDIIQPQPHTVSVLGDVNKVQAF